jgi:hypothetical protein
MTQALLNLHPHLIPFQKSAALPTICLFPAQKPSKEVNQGKTNLCPIDNMKNVPLT